MRTYFLRLLVLGVAWLSGGLPTQGQAYFNRRYPQPNGQQSYLTACLATSSGFIVTGRANDYSPALQSAVQVRLLTPEGRTQRVRYYVHPATAYSLSASLLGGLLPATGGGYVLPVLVSGAPVPNQLLRYPQLWRLDAQGDTLWTKSYPDPTTPQTIAFSAVATADGGYALVGTGYRERANGRPWQQAMLLRLDAAGNLLWRRYYGSLEQTDTRFLSATPDGGFLLSNFARAIYGSNTAYGYLLKVDSTGAVVWEKLLGNPAYKEAANASLVTRAGQYVVASLAGVPQLNGASRGRQRLDWYDPDGTRLRSTLIGPERSLGGTARLLEQPDGSIVGYGQQIDTAGAYFGTAEAFIYKVCAQGDSAWFRTYRFYQGAASDNYPTSFCQAPDGGFLGTGYLFGLPPDTLASDGWAFRVDADGHPLPGGTAPGVVCVPLGLPASGEAAGEAVRVYPNPSATGRWTLAGAGGATAVVSDARGRVVGRSRVPAGTEAPLTLPGGAPSGLYLLRLTWPDGRRLTIKLLKS